ncbi:MAG: F420-nonreducing hydrogenase [Candidatus Thorarchaeota archaeon]
MTVRIATMGMAGCSGCHIALLDIGVKLLDVLSDVELVYSYPVVDSKNPIPPNIDVALIEGSIRTNHDKEMAQSMRQQAKFLIAFGACAAHGGVNGLANIFNANEGMEYVYHKTILMAQKVIPHENVPQLLPTDLRLSDVVKVDFILPGCPPHPDEIAQVITTLLANGTPKLSSKSICDECPLEHLTKVPKQLRRTYEIPESDNCLLSQGFLCMGPATRAGCNAECTRRGMPCTGCRGPSETVWDQGIAMLDALAAMEEDEITNFKLPRLAGTFARYTYASSKLDNLRKGAKKE